MNCANCHIKMVELLNYHVCDACGREVANTPGGLRVFKKGTQGSDVPWTDEQQATPKPPPGRKWGVTRKGLMGPTKDLGSQEKAFADGYLQAEGTQATKGQWTEPDVVGIGIPQLDVGRILWQHKSLGIPMHCTRYDDVYIPATCRPKCLGVCVTPLSGAVSVEMRTRGHDPTVVADVEVQPGVQPTYSVAWPRKSTDKYPQDVQLSIAMRNDNEKRCDVYLFLGDRDDG